jgi:hypothetical protein
MQHTNNKELKWNWIIIIIIIIKYYILLSAPASIPPTYCMLLNYCYTIQSSKYKTDWQPVLGHRMKMLGRYFRCKSCSSSPWYNDHMLVRAQIVAPLHTHAIKTCSGGGKARTSLSCSERIMQTLAGATMQIRPAGKTVPAFWSCHTIQCHHIHKRWWRQQEPLKRRSTSKRLHSATTRSFSYSPPWEPEISHRLITSKLIWLNKLLLVMTIQTCLRYHVTDTKARGVEIPIYTNGVRFALEVTKYFIHRISEADWFTRPRDEIRHKRPINMQLLEKESINTCGHVYALHTLRQCAANFYKKLYIRTL